MPIMLYMPIFYMSGRYANASLQFMINNGSEYIVSWRPYWRVRHKGTGILSDPADVGDDIIYLERLIANLE